MSSTNCLFVADHFRKRKWRNICLGNKLIISSCPLHELVMMMRECLCLSPAFLPKGVSPNFVNPLLLISQLSINITASHHGEPSEHALLCPVCVPWYYMRQMEIQSLDLLFICHGERHRELLSLNKGEFHHLCLGRPNTGPLL